MSLILALLSLTGFVLSTLTRRLSPELPTLCIHIVSAYSDTSTQLKICESCQVFLPQVSLTSNEFKQYINDETFRSRVDACLRPGFTSVSVTIPLSISKELRSFDEFSEFAIWALLTCLRIEGETNVEDISALSLAPNLREVSFLEYTHLLTDISVLAQLPKLEVLRIGPTHLSGITDFSVLASLPSLTTLTLKGSLISDLSVFQHLPALTSLELSGATGISDLSFLTDLCPRLVRLDVSGTEISDILPLRQFCPNLKNLDISRTKVSDLSPMTALGMLESVGFGQLGLTASMQIPGVLSSLGNLRSVSLSGSDNVDLFSLLPSKRTLEKLEIAFSTRATVQNMNLLREFKALKVLDLRFSLDLVDIEFLKELKELEELDIRGSRVHDLSALSNLKKLRKLDISYTRVKDMTPIGGLTSLLELRASNIDAEFDLKPLKNLINLRVLDLDGNVELREISSLVGLVLLETLDLGMTQVTDIRLLLNFPNLRWLRLTDGYLRGLKALENLEKLESVTLGESEVFSSGEEFRAYLGGYVDDEDEDVEQDNIGDA